MFGKPKSRFQVARTNRKMASSVRKSADSAKTFVRPGTRKTIVTNKIKDVPSKEMSPKAQINVGMSSCPDCDILDKSNTKWLYPRDIVTYILRGRFELV